MITIAAVDSSVADKAVADVVCDGVNDQTDINTALGAGNIEVFLFNGNYQIDAPIDLPNGGILRGNSIAGVVLNCNTTSGVMRSSAPASRHEHVVVDSMRVTAGTQNDLGCDFRGFTRSYFTRLRVTSFDVGVWFGGDEPAYESSWTNSFNQFYLSQNFVGIKLSGTDGGGVSTANNIMLHQGEIICQDTSGGIAIDVVNGEITVDTCDIGYGDGADGIVLRSGVSTCRIVDSRFEWPSQDAGKYPIKILDGSDHHYIAGNYYTDGSTIPNVYVEDPVDSQYIQLDAYSRSDDVAYGSAIFNTGILMNVGPTFAVPIQIALDATSAVAVRNGDESLFVRFDTSSDLVSIANSGQFSLFSDALTTRKLNLNGSNGNLTLSGALISDGAAPSASVSAAAGTGASATVFGNDTAGLIRLITGTGTTTGQLFQITWSVTKPSGNYSLVLTAANSSAVVGLARLYVDQDTATATAIVAIATTALTASTTHKFYYQVVSF